MLLAMSKIVFKRVAPGFEHDMAFIFRLPSGSFSRNDFTDVSQGNGMVGDKSIAIGEQTIGNVGDDDSHQLTARVGCVSGNGI